MVLQCVLSYGTKKTYIFSTTHTSTTIAAGLPPRCTRDRRPVCRPSCIRQESVRSFLQRALFFKIALVGWLQTAVSNDGGGGGALLATGLLVVVVLTGWLAENAIGIARKSSWLDIIWNYSKKKKYNFFREINSIKKSPKWTLGSNVNRNNSCQTIRYPSGRVVADDDFEKFCDFNFTKKVLWFYYNMNIMWKQISGRRGSSCSKKVI